MLPPKKRTPGAREADEARRRRYACCSGVRGQRVAIPYTEDRDSHATGLVTHATLIGFSGGYLGSKGHTYPPWLLETSSAARGVWSYLFFFAFGLAFGFGFGFGFDVFTGLPGLGARISGSL